MRHIIDRFRWALEPETVIPPLAFEEEFDPEYVESIIDPEENE